MNLLDQNKYSSDPNLDFNNSLESYNLVDSKIDGKTQASENGTLQGVLALKKQNSNLKLKNRILLALNVVLIVLLAFSVYIHWYLSSPEKLAIRQLLAREYLRNLPSREKIQEGELKGLVSALEDPYSQYVTAKEAKELRDNLNRRYEGIGVVFDFDSELPSVEKVFPNSPASEAGIMVKDVLTAIEDQSVQNMSRQEVISKIRGQEGTEVNLNFRREDQEISKKLVRRQIVTELIELDFRQDVAIIKINSFGENLDQKMREVVERIRQSPDIKRLVVDLRGDSGGLLNEAVEVVSYFLEPNTLVLQEKSKHSLQKIYSKSKEPNLVNYPLVLLVDRQTASASEILVGALKEHKGAKLVGQKTFGKGVVQRIFPLQNGAQIKLTISEWLTPQGARIDQKGFEPDIQVEDKKDALEIALEQAF